jgi:alpha-glucosidase
MLLSMRGSVCLFQGEELGLKEAELAFEDLVDPYGIEFWPEFKGRDGCRTPMPWNAAKLNLGFSSGAPWLPLGETHAALAVSEQEQDPASTLNFFRAMMHERMGHSSLRIGDLKLLDAPLPLIAFIRGGDLLCVFNLGPDPIRWTLPRGATSCGFICPGTTEQDGDALTLGPSSAWFGRVQGL